MTAKVLFTSASSACFELDNDHIYYNDKPFKVTLNGKDAGEFNKNVFSLFGLDPNTEYTLKSPIFNSEIVFKTKEETACLNTGTPSGIGSMNIGDMIEIIINDSMILANKVID